MTVRISNDINDLYEHSGLHEDEFAALIGCNVERLESLRTGISEPNPKESRKLTLLMSALNGPDYEGQPAEFVRRKMLSVNEHGISEYKAILTLE